MYLLVGLVKSSHHPASSSTREMKYSIFTCLLLGVAGASAQNLVASPAATCKKLAASIAIQNVTVNFVEYLPAGSNITLTQAYNLSTCGYTSQVITHDLCRVAMYVATSYRSGE